MGMPVLGQTQSWPVSSEVQVLGTSAIPPNLAASMQWVLDHIARQEAGPVIGLVAQQLPFESAMPGGPFNQMLQEGVNGYQGEDEAALEMPTLTTVQVRELVGTVLADAQIEASGLPPSEIASLQEVSRAIYESISNVEATGMTVIPMPVYLLNELGPLGYSEVFRILCHTQAKIALLRCITQSSGREYASCYAKYIVRKNWCDNHAKALRGIENIVGDEVKRIVMEAVDRLKKGLEWLLILIVVALALYAVLVLVFEPGVLKLLMALLLLTFIVSNASAETGDEKDPTGPPSGAAIGGAGGAPGGASADYRPPDLRPGDPLREGGWYWDPIGRRKLAE